MLSHEKIPDGTMVTSSPSPTLLVATPLPPPPLTLSIRGPFGAPALNYAAYQHIVVIGSGIGVTPLLSMWKYLVNYMKAATTTTTTTIVTGAAATTIFDSEDATDANIKVNDNRNLASSTDTAPLTRTSESITELGSTTCTHGFKFKLHRCTEF
jgi:NAD(P)H-flavin reductase